MILYFHVSSIKAKYRHILFFFFFSVICLKNSKKRKILDSSYHGNETQNGCPKGSSSYYTGLFVRQNTKFLSSFLSFLSLSRSKTKVSLLLESSKNSISLASESRSTP